MNIQPAELTRWLVGRVSDLTGLRPDEIDIDLPLHDIGLGSAQAAELAVEMTELLGTDVHPATAFEYPTIRALAEAMSGPASRAGRVAAPATTGPGAERTGGMAIVGMSVRVPGADSADDLWRLLRNGRDPVGEIPTDRWRLDRDSLTKSEYGAGFAGLLGDIASFDAGFFHIPREEAVRMDPQQRLLLQAAWESLEDAGQVPARIAGSSTGVYVGISTNDYARRQLSTADDINALTPTGNAMSIAANRISYELDLRGPS
ncbi:MAG: beta-ketoacyl synthase N-terminal-like domain-containing protein, partial [Streptosporangiaceae bacterium]